MIIFTVPITNTFQFNNLQEDNINKNNIVNPLNYVERR